MPNVAEADLIAFGKAVNRARSLEGWTLDTLGGKISPPMAKFFLSRVENGKRQISTLTVGKLIRALPRLDEAWIDRFLDADIAPEDEETPNDRIADRLIQRAEADPDAPETPETLLLLLAEEWASHRFTDPMMAYTALKGAIQAAAEMRAQGAMPSNVSAQFQAVMRRVAELNDAGYLDEADAALKDAADRHEAEGESLFNALLQQDKLRNRPAEAAKRHIQRQRNAAPPGGLFLATRDLLSELRELGERMGDPFDLAVALELAKLNNARAKGPLLGQALLSLGVCHFSLGERQSGSVHLARAIKVFSAALKYTPRKQQPENWAAMQNNLGGALLRLEERDGDGALLHDAIAAYTAALTVHTQEAAPMDWAMTQNNLGNTLRALGERECSSARLQAAIAAFTAALTVHTQEAAPMDWAITQNNLGIARRWLGWVAKDATQFDLAETALTASLTYHTREDAPFPWAQTQWNLADLALARLALQPAPGLLTTAQTHLDAAGQVFAEAENEHQLAECDRLQALIDAAGGAGSKG